MSYSKVRLTNEKFIQPENLTPSKFMPLALFIYFTLHCFIQLWRTNAPEICTLIICVGTPLHTRQWWFIKMQISQEEVCNNSTEESDYRLLWITALGILHEVFFTIISLTALCTGLADFPQAVFQGNIQYNLHKKKTDMKVISSRVGRTCKKSASWAGWLLTICKIKLPHLMRIAYFN